MGEQAALFHVDVPPEPERPARKRWGGRDSEKARAIVRRMLPGACWRCGRPLDVDDKWHAGHVQDRMDGGQDSPDNLAPECEPCNLSAGGKRGAAITNGPATERRVQLQERTVKWW